MEIIPAIDIRGGRCVRLVQGDYGRETVFGDDPAAMARRWVEEGAQRLHLVDLDGAKAGRPVNLDAVRAVREAVRVPCQFGGGVRDDAALHTVLVEVGLDRVIVGTQALRRPEWFREAVERHPGRVALGLDARGSMVATAGWLEISETPAIELARRCADLPLAAIIYTNIEGDGMLQGVGEDTIADLIELAQLGPPIIASGGVTNLDDVHRLTEVSRRHPNLVGAVVGRAIYEGTLKLGEALAAAATA